MLAPPPRIWPAPPPAHINGASAATRYGYSSLAQILPSPQDKGDDQSAQIVQQVPQGTPIYSEEPVKIRKESKHVCTTADWRRKERGRVKIEPGLTPCQVQEVTTSSKLEQNGGIPIGIAVARQRVQTSTPPPLTVLTCEERSTNHVTGWTGPHPHWHYPPGLDQNMPSLCNPPLQLGRDPLSGQLLILPSGSIGESIQRTVLWPNGATGSSSAPPPLVMPAPQPLLLDRFVTLPPQGIHHHHEKRRSHEHSTTTIQGGSSGGLTVGLFPPQHPPQTPLFMMPFSHQNNSLLLSTQLTEHNLNTMVVTNHQLSESAVLNPMEVITSPVDGFGGGGMLQQIPPSVVISHTETNSFVRSDINTVYPAQQVQTHPQIIQPEQIVIKEEAELPEETQEEEPVVEETKAEVMDASNQTESPVEESEEEEISVKEEAQDNPSPVIALPEHRPPVTLSALDMSGLELLSCVVASAKKETSETLIPPVLPALEAKKDVNEWSDEPQNVSSRFGMLCTAVELILEEEVVADDCNGVGETSLPQEELKANDKTEEELSEVEEEEEEEMSDGKMQSTLPVKREEWFTEIKENGKDMFKTILKRRPGRPKKKPRTIKKQRSPNRQEPPVLQPWSASVNVDKYPLGSPPTLTPHKRKLSNDLSQESDEGNSSTSSSHPPPLSPACSGSSSSKRRKVGRPKKSVEAISEKTDPIPPKPMSPTKTIVDLLTTNAKPQDHQQPTGSQNKIKPKLKAEAKVKDWYDDEELDLNPVKENNELDSLLPLPPVWPAKPKNTPLSPPRKPKVKIVEELKKETRPEVKLPTPVRTVIKLKPSATQINPHEPPSQLRNKSPTSPSKSPVNKAKTSLSLVTTPVKAVLPHPTKVAALPAKIMPSPARSTPPPVKVELHPAKATSPPAKVALPIVKAAPKPVKAELPPAKTTPPSAKVVLPTPKTTPPSSTKPTPQPPKIALPTTKTTPLSAKTISPSIKSTTLQAKTPSLSTKFTTSRAKTPPPPRKNTPSPVSQKANSNKLSTPHRTPDPKSASTPEQETSQITPKKTGSPPVLPDCKITEDRLSSLPCRILTISDGQFYPGEVSKVILPGIFEVQIYKERCRKPQILCQDEVLTSSVAEIYVTENMFIPAGTRVCAYWSQQYSCFYPGSVVSNSPSGQIPIDFDDGDNGNIDRTSVRLLPPDYPIVEQPPNPLVGKRKRYNSTASSDGLKHSLDSTESEPHSPLESGKKLKVPFKEEKKPEPQAQGKSSLNGGQQSDFNDTFSDSDDCSSSDETGASETTHLDESDTIRSVLEGFFRSEQEEKERLKNGGDKVCKRHKHHKHKEGSKVHKCKHSKHHRSHKHKRSRDEVPRLTNGAKNGNVEKESSCNPQSEKKNLMKPVAKEESTPTENETDEKFVDSKKSKTKQEWLWVGEGIKRGRALGPRGKGLKLFYKAIKRGSEVIKTGDCAVFVSTGRPDRPFIGQIEQFWQCHMKKNMVVKIAWFYHPEETIGCPDKLPCPGGVFKSSHIDHNDVLTISHRCEVLPLPEFQAKAKKKSGFLDKVYESNNTYYLAGFYDPSNITLTLEPEVAAELENENKKDTN